MHIPKEETEQQSCLAIVELEVDFMYWRRSMACKKGGLGAFSSDIDSYSGGIAPCRCESADIVRRVGYLREDYWIPKRG